MATERYHGYRVLSWLQSVIMVTERYHGYRVLPWLQSVTWVHVELLGEAEVNDIAYVRYSYRALSNVGRQDHLTLAHLRLVKHTHLKRGEVGVPAKSSSGKYHFNTVSLQHVIIFICLLTETILE